MIAPYFKTFPNLASETFELIVYPPSKVGPNWIFNAEALNILKSTFLGLSIIVLMKKVKKMCVNMIRHIFDSYYQQNFNTGYYIFYLN